jgi:alkylation response protein AidB-like acyl-CoA dehydrogenase
MHGGIGVTDEYDIGFFLKRARVAEQIFGSSNFILKDMQILVASREYLNYYECMLNLA